MIDAEKDRRPTNFITMRYRSRRFSNADSRHRPLLDHVQLRYNFRIEPTPGQETALAKAFGCARVVYNDALTLRRSAQANGAKQLSDTELQRQVVTLAKKTEQRAWLADVPSVVLTQALRDLGAAFSAFFNSRSGKRKGPKVSEPRFRSRKDSRQSIRFTRDAFRLRKSGRLYLAKIGEIKVRWSRQLPSAPSSATVIKDATGRYFVSFVVESGPNEDASRFAEASGEVGIDLGLTAFATLSDGTVIDNPTYLRRAERRLCKA